MNPAYDVLSNNQPYLLRYTFTEIGVSVTTDSFGGNEVNNLNDLPAGNTSAVSNGKQISVSPTNISSIQLSAEQYGFFLSRSYTGTPCHVDIEMFGYSPLRMLTGIVGSIKNSGTSIEIEIVGDMEKLKTEATQYTIQSTCNWNLGEGKCTVPKQEQIVPIVNVSGKVLTIAPSGVLPLALSSQFSWEAIIGNDGYLIDVSASSVSTITVDRNVLGNTRALKIRRYCNRSYENCGVYNNRRQFSGIPFLATSSLNYVL
jgi:hypothetical protein